MLSKKLLQIEIGYGEAIDRLSILSIKHVKITNPVKLKKIHREYMELWKTLIRVGFEDIFTDIDFLYLREVNDKLWKVEDSIREMDSKKAFGNRFVELARSVYRLNDERSRLKRMIDEKYGCPIGEIKSYKEENHGDQNEV